MIIQEVKAAAAEAVKDLAAHEKQQVGLEERSKHAKSKAKKLKKLVQDVSYILYWSSLIFVTLNYRLDRTRMPKPLLSVPLKIAPIR